jgi:mRNA interferase RelE/StbE
MAWSLRFASAVSHELKRLDRSDARFILDTLERFAADFGPAYECELLRVGKVKHLKGEWEGYFRLRLRSFRVIYRKYQENLVILVVRVSHRREAYRT